MYFPVALFTYSFSYTESHAILVFHSQDKAREPLKEESYTVMLYKRKKSQVKFMEK